MEEAAIGCQKLILEGHEDADVVQHGKSSRFREALGAFLEAAEEVLRVTFGVAIEVSRATLGMAEGVLHVMLETEEVVLGVVLVTTREVLRVVIGSVGLLLHEVDAENMGRLDSELSESVVVEMVARPIVELAEETEAFREKSVAKGASCQVCEVWAY
jgi:hypothetical protein